MTLTRSRGDGNGGNGIVIMPADQKYANVVIWMHGLGDTADVSVLNFILPTAPTRPISLNGGFMMPGWTDVYGLDETSKEDKEGFEQSAARIQALIDSEKAKGIPAQRVVVAGFSQGGATALHVALRTKDALGGCVACSGWLPLAKEYPAALGDGAKAGLKVLQCHGDADVVVRHHWGSQSYNALKAMGIAAELETYRGMGHSAIPDELERVSAFIQQQFRKACD
ncbi:lysophospholipase-like protein II [Tribonema minus]|uniref:Lysophospholipase-like protein II n=1 Tax=Tribonema minus TaxID=303371 RepID=A0A836CN32_9STRA|nr:lysophospholipase-like protein II [Tribonema minus]